MWKTRAIYIAVILATGAVYIATNERYLYVFLIILVLLPVLSFIMLQRSARKVGILCESFGTCVIYQKIGMNLKMKYKGHFPIGNVVLETTYHNYLFQNQIQQKMILKGGKSEDVSYEIPYISKDCGHVKMTITDTIVYDIMGLFSKKIKSPVPENFTVYPQISDLDVTFTRLPQAKNLGDHYDQNRKGQDVTEVFGIREYQEGDSQRSIHWKLSSKWNQLMVREFSNPSNYDTLVLYDTHSMDTNDVYHPLVNGVLGVTASISKSLLKQNHMHHVGCMKHSEFMDNQVENQDSFLQMLNNMMSTPLTKKNKHMLDDFLKVDVVKDFTKIIFVTCNFDSYYVQQLSNFVDLTVVFITENQENYMESKTDYDVIIRSLESLSATSWSLDI